MNHITYTLAGCIALGLLSLSPASHAGGPTIITVTTTADVMDGSDGLCSLREAIYSYNNQLAFSANPGECPAAVFETPTVIQLASGDTYQLTIPGSGMDEGDLDVLSNPVFPSGGFELRIETIGGVLPATILQTIGNQRVIENFGANLEIFNVTLQGGSVAGVGGGLLNNSGKLRLEQVRFIGNNALVGGGLYSFGPAVTEVINGAFELNMASSVGGGGIYNGAGAQLTLSNTSVRANQGPQGGGILNDGGTVSIQAGSSINLNTATSSHGGGISNIANGTLSISSSTLDSNTASQDGGAIHHHSIQQLPISNSSFSGNNGGNGSAIWVVTDASPVISNSTFTNNQAVAGTVFAFNSIVSNSRFEDNTASFLAGAILSSGATDISNSEFIDNRAIGSNGGAVYAGIVRMRDSLVQGNESGGSGGGVSATVFAEIERSRFIDNRTGEDGGGIHIDDESDTGNISVISRTLVTDNHSSNNGGGIWVRAKMDLSNTTISLNGANNGGGGLFIHTQGDVLAVNMTLTGHLNGQDLHKYGILTMQNSIITTPGQPDCLTSLDHPVIISLGNNIVDDASCDISHPTDLTAANVMLDELTDLGGNSPTHPPLPGSPAINGGNNAACNGSLVQGVDQRGAPRPEGAACDVGAHEVGAVAPPFDRIFADGFEGE